MYPYTLTLPTKVETTNLAFPAVCGLWSKSTTVSRVSTSAPYLNPDQTAATRSSWLLQNGQYSKQTKPRDQLSLRLPVRLPAVTRSPCPLMPVRCVNCSVSVLCVACTVRCVYCALCKLCVVWVMYAVQCPVSCLRSVQCTTCALAYPGR